MPKAPAKPQVRMPKATLKPASVRRPKAAPLDAVETPGKRPTAHAFSAKATARKMAKFL